ncbi:MAG: phosphotransferase [Rhodobacteraceae bacterium]|nr:phosphotransferase [Paracoccaceae bacterium]
MTFPVSQSVLDATALAGELARLYGLKGPVKCRLISRGMNDIFEVVCDGGRFAAKVARTGKSTDGEFGFEQAFVQHLAAARFLVPAPIPLTDGKLFFTVDAPEGPRQIALMRWLDGTPCTKMLTLEDARRLGSYLGRMHRASENFTYPVPRPLYAESKLKARLPKLIAMLGDDPDTAAFLTRAVDGAIARIESLDPASVPRGAIHGDFQYANVMQMADGSVAVFDFNDCGQDFIVRDLTGFFWRADFDGVGAALNPAFVAGYEAIRPLLPAERAALPLFRAARHLLLTCSMAEFIDRVGPIPGFDGNLRYYLSMIRLHCAEAGLG